MNDTEKSLEVGKEYLYTEDGGVERIKILEVKVDKSWLHVKFEILEVFKGGLCSWDEKKVGKIVDVNKVTDVYIPFAMWEINPLE